MSSTKKIKVSPSTALVVIPTPVPAAPAKKVREKAWKVYRIYCTVTKASYFGICLSYKTVNGLVSSFNYGVRVGNSELSVCSIRQHGIENHIFTFVSVNFPDRKEALAEKGRVILRFSRNRPLLNQNAQTECGVTLSPNPKGMLIPNWTRGRLATSDTDGE